MTVAGVGLSEDLSAAALGSVGGNDQLPTPRAAHVLPATATTSKSTLLTRVGHAYVISTK